MSQELTSACSHMHLQHNLTYASQPPMTLLHMPCEAFMRMAWVCVHTLLTMLVLSSTDLRPEITSRDMYGYKHLTLHRTLSWCCFKSLYRVIRLFIRQYPMMGTQPSNMQTGDLIQPLHCMIPPPNPPKWTDEHWAYIVYIDYMDPHSH